MNSQTFGLRVAGTIFGIMGIGHLVRLFTHTEIVVSDYSAPLWLSAVLVLIAGGLSFWMWRLSVDTGK